jgi:hypothetical protein
LTQVALVSRLTSIALVISRTAVILDFRFLGVGQGEFVGWLGDAEKKEPAEVIRSHRPFVSNSSTD